MSILGNMEKKSDGRSTPNKHLLEKQQEAKIRFAKEAPHCPVDWKDDPMFALWMENKERKRGGDEIPKKVLYMIDFWIPRYISFHRKSISELIGVAHSDPKNHRGADDITKFKKHALEYFESTEASIHNGCYSLIRGMYSMLDISTKTWYMPNKPKSKNSAQDLMFPLFKTVRKKAVLNREYIIPWLDKLSARNRTIAICMISTGMDWEDLATMTIEDVLLQSGQEYLYHKGNRQKPPHTDYVAIFSREATEMVNNYIKFHRQNRKSNDEPIFSSHNLGAAAITTRFQIAFKSLNIPFKAMTHQPYRPKRLRHLYRNTFIKVPADDGVRQAFMGHKKDVAHYYLELPKDDLVELFKPREHLLTVYAEVKSEDDYMEAINAFQMQNVELDATKRDLAATKNEYADFRKKYKKDMRIIYQKTLPAEIPEGVSPDVVKFMFTLMKDPKLLEKYLKQNTK